jgi:alpha-tubulin suppressor-like RCC1 family protein
VRSVFGRLAVCVGALLLVFGLLPSRLGANARAEGNGATLASTSTYAQTILGDTPQAYWRLDELSGTTFADSTGRGNTGTLNSGVTLGAPGAIASDPTDTSVLLGTATGVHINVASPPAISTTGGVSLEAWVNPISTAGSGPTVVSLNASSNLGTYNLTVTTSGTNAGLVSFRGGISSTQTGIISSAAGAAPNGQWSYLVGTFDGTTMKLYVNGTLVTSHTASASLGQALTSATLGGNNLQGDLDEVAVYGYALTASQVQAHFNASISTPTPTATPTATPASTLTNTSTATTTNTPTATLTATLTNTATATPSNTTTPVASLDAYASTILADTPQAYWRLNETSGTIAFDSSGNGYNGVYDPSVTLGAPGALISDPSNTGVILGTTTQNHISAKSVATLNTSQGISLEAWVNTTPSTGNSLNIVSSNSAAKSAIGSYVLTIASSGTNSGLVSWRTGLTGSAKIVSVASAKGAAPPGQWAYVVGTYDGSTMVLYLNGVAIGSLSGVSGTIGDALSEVDLGGPALLGGLDEVAEYGYALSASQVLAHYNAAITPPTATSTPTGTIVPTNTPTATPTNTNTPTVTNTPVVTNTVTPSPSITPTSTLTPVVTVTVAAGPGPMAVGKNVTGQIGDGTTVNRSVPVPVINLANVTVMGGGAFHSLAVESDGSVWAWGNNTFGQVGNGSNSGPGNTGVFTPTQVLGVSGAINVAGGGIQSGQQHSLALKSDGTVWGWGSNGSGQLGNGTTTSATRAGKTLVLTDTVAIAAGGQHSLALKNDGTVWAFGSNSSGQLGIGNLTNQSTPVQVTALSGIIAIAAGGNHSLAVKNDGTVWAWGNNVDGQLGNGTTSQQTTPVQVSGLTGATLVAAGNVHSVALKSDGTVWAWGDNSSAELGTGTTGGTSTSPVQVTGLASVTAISSQANGKHTLALKSDGSVWGWGANVFGQLGDGTTTTRSAPVQMTGLSGRAASLSAGGSHSLILEAVNPQSTADSSGQVETFSSTGSINPTGAFFQSLGTNSRTCATCHIQTAGWSITPQQAVAVMNATQGLDPLFTTNDGTDSPNADVSTFQARQAASHMLLSKGIFRIGIPTPANAEFTLTAINDPYNFATASQLSLFRRPLPATNLGFQSEVMWDGRETIQPMTTTNTIQQNLANLTFDLSHQSVDATTGHAAASISPSVGQQNDMVSFELAFATAQGTDSVAGSLTALGATGGSQALSTQPFTIAVNDFASAGFNPVVFTLFTPWANLTGTDTVSLQRESIARGENIFNTRQFTITGVNGLNDVLNQSSITGTCSTCHDSPNLGNRSAPGPLNSGVAQEMVGVDLDFPTYTFTNNATGETMTTTDPGLGLITGKWADLSKFKVPTLRGLSSRAPYFHSGVGTTFLDVIHQYNARFNIGFSTQDENDLANFLGAL